MTVRITHAVANALVITSTFTYSACEFPKNVAKIFSITRWTDTVRPDWGH